MMPRSSFVTGHVFALLILLLIILNASYTCTAETEQCAPSSCGNISNINYPFLRLKGDRRTCAEGEVIFELACEEDNRTTLSLPPGNNKYYVQNISYFYQESLEEYSVTLELVDAGLDAENYCSIPLSSFPLSKLRGSEIQRRGFHVDVDSFSYGSLYFMSCSIPIRLSKATVNYSSCINNTSSASQTNQHFYAIVLDYNSSLLDIPDSCNVSISYPITSDLDYNNLSISYIHQKLLLGFQVDFYNYEDAPSRSSLYWFLQHMRGDLTSWRNDLKTGNWSMFFWDIRACNPVYKTIGLFFIVRASIGIPCLIALVVYRCRRRHLSVDDTIENFLQSHNNFMPIRCESYAEKFFLIYLSFLEQKKQKLSEIKAGLNEAEALIRNINLGTRSLQPNVKAVLLAKLREYKFDLNNLKSDIKRIQPTNLNQAAQDELLESGMANTQTVSVDQRARLLMLTKRLNKSSDRVRDSKKTTLETEDLGVSILHYLRQHCQSLLHAQVTLHGVGDNISKETFSAFGSQLDSYERANTTFTTIARHYRTLFRASARNSSLHVGERLHASVITTGLLTCPNSYLHNPILHVGFDHLDGLLHLNWDGRKSLLLFIDMQKHCVLPDAITLVFDDLKEKTVVSWTVLLESVYCWFTREAFKLLDEMLFNLGLGLNNMTVSSLLSACTQSGDLMMGRWLHVYVLKMIEKEIDIMVGTSLIDIYAKCGRINIAFHIFKKVTNKNIVAWNAMLGGLAMHGWGNLVLDIFPQMVKEVKPDDVTFTSVLTLCSHSGLIDQGHHYFYSLESSYGINPSMEHYACMLDLLGRAGELDEAETVIRAIPIVPNKVVLSKQERANSLRKILKDRGIRKIPGISSIHVGGHVFSGFGKDNEDEQEEKEQALFFHSEKLAVWFGLMSTGDGASIYIFKNLRICQDFHSAMKIVSAVYERDIVIRDRSRFHCFKQGSCSCTIIANPSLHRVEEGEKE
ncbi:hypothetical protein LguiB_013295 [Lonicera macranthoides]